MYTFRWSALLSGVPLSAMSAALVVGSCGAQAAELPIPCAGGACGPNTAFITSGGASVITSGNTLNVTQTTNSAILNWQKFNISADGTVNFKQPDVSSVALNRIWQNDPSRIFGALNANGRVYLLNQNGILFGATAKVNVGALVASSLDITPAAVQQGIAGAINSGAPAFQSFKGADGKALPSGSVSVEPGATINSPAGQVMLFAPEVVNRGTISTPDGQTILGAGDRVFLASSTDDNLRGLLVEVSGKGSVTNGEDANATRAAAAQVGAISADRGNVTLAGLLVRQQGQISATTSTRANGSIRLLARVVADNGTAQPADMQLATQASATIGGTLTVADNSTTAVTLDTKGTDTTVDVNTQPVSRVQLSGKNIGIGAGSSLVATGGTIDIAANATPANPTVTRDSDGSSLVIASGARLDVSGAHTTLAMERNVIRVELRGNQLADSPLQRDSALRSEPVFVDARQYGTRSDGSSWQGTPLADVSGDISNIRRDVSERNLSGGTINLASRGALVVGKDANLDVSGGYIDWQSGYIITSKLLGADGKVYDISQADRDRQYLRLLDPRTVTNRRWGVTENLTVQGLNPAGQFEAGYREGRDAGTVSIQAPQAVLDGNIVGTTEAGRYQRKAPVTGSGPRRYDVLPRAATLNIGAVSTVAAGVNPTERPDLILPDVELTGGFIVPAGVKLGDALPQSLTSIRIRSDLFGEDRVGNLAVTSNGTIHIAAGNAVNLPAFGSVMFAAPHIDIDANISAPSGRITGTVLNTIGLRNDPSPLAKNSLSVAPGVTLNTAGTWVNDDMRLNPNGATAALSTEGGSISLSVLEGTLDIGAGSLLDVSAGAQRRADGTVRDGAGGSITLATSAPETATRSGLSIAGTLRGSALSRGGSVSISAGTICITGAECRIDDADLTLTPQWFRQGGFGSISLTSNQGDLVLEDNTTLSLRQRNLELLSASIGAATGTAMSAITREVELADYLRKPLNLSLTAGFQQAGSLATGDLRLGRGSAVLADPLASLSLRTNSSMFLDGTVRAPGGKISALVDASNSVRFYSKTQGLWVGPDALLSLAGTTIYTPAVNQLKGSVLGGGTLSLTAQRGFIVTDQSSVLDVSGTSAPLDVGTSLARLRRQTVSSAGGTLNVTAAEGILLNGALRGQSGAPGQVMGGTLNVALDPNQRNFTGTTDKSVDGPGNFPRVDRRILVAGSGAPISVTEGGALPDEWLGTARLAAATVSTGGFDSLSLTAINPVAFPLVDTKPFRAGYGRIEFEPGVRLATRARIEMNAAAIGLRGGEGKASVASSYVGIGHDDGGALDADKLDATLQEAPTPVAGNGSFSVEANFIDLLGLTSITGVAQTVLHSNGDIRGRGLLDETLNTHDYRGRLDVAGTLTLEAKQIYPATLANFTFSAHGADAAVLIRPVAGPADAVLSAGGRLAIEAPHIESTGVLRAPFGTIDLEADTIDLLAGSMLSTSAQGQLIPFGTTQGGLSWAYQQSNDVTRIFGPGGEPLPEQRVVLNAKAVNLASGGTIDVSGGGDLLSYEFVKGPGGSTDVLSPTVRPNQFAIIPAANPGFAPYDAAEMKGVNLRTGDTIWLGPGSGVPEGFYTLMPARYALLPGAYLVSPVSGYQDIAAGESYAQRSGGVVVAGRRGISGTSLVDSRTSGWLVRPGTDVFEDAHYDLSKGNELLPKIDPELKSTRLPRDAGTVSLLATTNLALDGVLRAAIDKNGRGSTLEVSAPSITVVAAGGSAAPGSLAVSASQLSSLGAQRLIIGGRRSIGDKGEVITAQAASVTLDKGAALSSPEVMLVGRDLVRVAEGATLSATGAAFTADESFQLSQGASLVRVSTAGQVDVGRTTTGSGLGRLQLDTGSLVKAPGSVTLDVGGSALTAGNIDVGTGSLGLGASRIALGSAPETYAGVVVDSTLLGAVGHATLALNARDGLDLFDGTNFVARSVEIKTPVISTADADLTAHITADSLKLTGAASGSTTPSAGTGHLDISASSLELGGGKLAFAGFDTANVSVSGVTRITGDGSLRGPEHMGLSSGLITGDAGKQFSFESAGALTLGVASLTAQQLASAPDELGASIAFLADSIAGSARVRAAGGKVDFHAQGAHGDVALGADISIDVSGRTVHFGEADVAAPGGSVRLASDTGSVSLANGSRIDVSAAALADASAGKLTIEAAQGSATLGATVVGSATQAANGGSIDLVAGDFDFAQVQSALTSGAFTGDWSIWKRGSGALEVAAGTTIRARSVALTADRGFIRVDGTIDSSTGRGGHITLATSGGIDVTGTLDAHATDPDVRGGRIDLFTESAIHLAASSVLNVSGTPLSDPALDPGGTISIRAPRAAFLSLVDNDHGNDDIRLGGTVTGARGISLEGMQSYDVTSGSIGTPEMMGGLGAGNVWYDDAAAFMANAAGIVKGLGLGPEVSSSVVVRPGIELRTAGDLSVGEPDGPNLPGVDWNLFDWRFGDDNSIAGVLSLRAGGTITFKGSLSDGFATPTDAALPDMPGDSWSYRIAGGADLASANPLATQRGVLAGGDVVVGPSLDPMTPGSQRVIRTGTGTIDIAAAGDLKLTDQGSVIYTAGRKGPGVDLTQSPLYVLSAPAPFPVDGGDISISVGRDVVGARSTQMFTDWLYRTGGDDGQVPLSTAWVPIPTFFDQGVATLGGGNLAVHAGRDVLDLSASTPSIGRQTGGLDLADNVVQTTGGGDLSVIAEGSILGGQFYVDHGVGVLRAGDSVGAVNESSLAPILALGASSLAVRARGDVTITTAINPTLIEPVIGGGMATFPSYFGTYSADSKLSLLSTGGDAKLGIDLSDSGKPAAAAFAAEHPFITLNQTNSTLLTIMPPSIDALALAGSIETLGPVTMWPAPRGNLRLLAHDDVTLGEVIMSDAALGSFLPTADKPQVQAETFGNQFQRFTQDPAFYAPRPVHSADGGDPDPALIAALTGDVTGENSAVEVFVPKPLRVSAGRDVTNFTVRIQHFDDSNVSTLSAGRDIIFPSVREPNGKLQFNPRQISIDGPGRLELIAGRHFDLQNSAGVTSRGALVNSGLPAGGADISVTAGLAGRQPAYDAFIDEYLATGAAYDAQLQAYVTRITGKPVGSKAQALTTFRQFSRNTQRGLLEAVLFAELRAGGRSAAAAGTTHGDFERAFKALETMFPGANPDIDAGETNPYAGDIRLYFSRIYTLNGGSIDLMAPGGEINVGLATPPTAFGITKSAADLGLVVQSAGDVNALSYNDFQVNESRTFAADGGNILVWSTRGDIDAGRGAKTAVSAPPPEITHDAQGGVKVTFKAALSGSGIQTLATTANRKPGDVDLFAPRGVVNAGDAGIVAGNLTVAATAVLGANNIQVSGTSVGVPVETSGLGVSLASASSVASGAANEALASTDTDDHKRPSEAPLADSALGWLDVFIEGFGEETCKPNDTACLERQQKH